MRGIAILLLIVLFFSLCWPAISKWLKRKAMEKADNYLRQAMGMPPREKKKGRTGRSHENDDYYRNAGSSQGYYSGGSGRRDYYHSDHNGSIIPKEYAEDVEYVETKEFSSAEKTFTSSQGTFHESQVSDVEFTEIKVESKESKR